MDLETFLHALPAFERFSKRQLDILLSNLEMREIGDGERLLTQGEQGAAMYILVSGKVHITRRDTISQEEQDAGEARDGEVFGLLSLVEHIPSPDTCTAEGPATVAALTPERYHALFLLSPSLARQLQYMVAVQLARELQWKNQSLRKGLTRQKSPSLLERLFGVSG